MSYPPALAFVGGDDSPIDGLVGFAKGYVVLDGSGGAVWYSKDGRSWKRVKLPFDLPLDEARDGNGMLGRVITTNGSEVLVVGGYSHEPCGKMPPGATGGLDCAVSPLAWISDDGVTWRSADLGPAGDEMSEFVAAWPVADVR